MRSEKSRLITLSSSVWLSILLASVFSACTADPNAAILENPSEAQQWLRAELQQGQSSSIPPEVNRLSEQLRNRDRRLVRTVDMTTPIPDTVFLAMNGAAAEKAPTALKRAGAALNTEPRPTVRGDSVGGDLPLSPASPQIESANEPDLSQADARQIKYLGLMQVDGESFGLVRVQSRVYRVAPNMRIGRGQWRVLQLDAAQMQLLVNGKTVHYDK